MTKNKFYLRVVIILIAVIVVSASIFLAVVLFNAQGWENLSNRTYISLWVTITGAALGAGLSLLSSFLVTPILSRKRKRSLESSRLAEDVIKTQLEDYSRLSKREQELEREKTVLQKQTRDMIWTLAAIEQVDDDPRLAIVLAYHGVESEIQSLISRVFLADTSPDIDKKNFSASYDYDFLIKSLSPDDANSILKMVDLRNRVVHGAISDEEIKKLNVKDYVQEALRLSQVISHTKQGDEN